MKFRHFLGIVELRTKIVSVGTFTVACLYVLWSRGSIPPLLAFMTFAAALLVDMGTTGFNTYFDWYRNVDDRRHNRESDKVLIHEGVEPGAALIVSLACFAGAAVLGLGITLLTSPWIAAAGALCMLVGFFYSGGPRPLSATPFGELFAGGFLGSVFFVLVVFILSGSSAYGGLGAAFCASLPQTLSIASILAANNACDILGDTEAGRRTLAIVVGPKRAPWIVYASGGAGLALMAVLAWLGMLPAWAAGSSAIAAVFIGIGYRRMQNRGFSHATKGKTMGAVSGTFILQAGAFAVGIIIDLVVHL